MNLHDSAFASSYFETKPLPSESNILNTLIRFYYLNTTEFYKQQAMNSL